MALSELNWSIVDNSCGGYLAAVGTNCRTGGYAIHPPGNDPTGFYSYETSRWELYSDDGKGNGDLISSHETLVAVVEAAEVHNAREHT